MPKVVLSGYIDVPASDLEAVTKELPNHIQLTLAESGCLAFQVTPEAETAGRFNVYEEFENEEAFELHQQRVANSHWGKITTNVSRNYEISKGE